MEVNQIDNQRENWYKILQNCPMVAYNGPLDQI